MAKTSVADWDTTAADNTDVGGISLAENVMKPPAVNDAFREIMAQIATLDPLSKDGSNATGRLGATASAITNWNNATENGWYVGSNAANAPVPSTIFLGNVEWYGGSGWGTQTVHRVNQDSEADTMTYRREMNAGVWGPWYRLRISEAEQKANYVGTVSQSGGVPTGAVIQRGSNANGNWERFADGTQVCYQSSASQVGSDRTWIFPAAFAAAPVSLQISPQTGLTGGAVALFSNNKSASSVSFSGWDMSNSRVAMAVSMEARGRWY